MKVKSFYSGEAFAKLVLNDLDKKVNDFIENHKKQQEQDIKDGEHTQMIIMRDASLQKKLNAPPKITEIKITAICDSTFNSIATRVIAYYEE